MTRYIITRPASQDIDEILEYITGQSVQTALKVAQRFEESFLRIADMPGIGHARGELRDKNARVISVSGFLVVYDPTLSPIHILRVVRGARNLANMSTR